MRFTLWLMTALAAAAAAGPVKLDEKKYPWLQTCNSEGDKTKETWKKNDIGEWFIGVANQKDHYTTNIQQYLLDFDNGADLYQGTCVPMESCHIDLDKDKCKKNVSRPYVYFVLYAIQNFNNWMKSLSDAVDSSAIKAGFKAADMVKKFTANEVEPDMDAAGPTIAAGVIGTIGGLVPIIGNVAGVGTGVATIAAGVATLASQDKEVDLEPDFHDFAAVQDYFGTNYNATKSGLASYTKWLLKSIPENDRDNGIRYIDDVKALPNLLKSGEFAEQREAEDPFPETIMTSFFSGAISVLWKSELAFIVKVHHDEYTLDHAPCDEKEFFNGNKWCDDEGNAYVLLRWPQKFTKLESPKDSASIRKIKDLRGVDKLKDYYLDVEGVIQASRHALDLNDGEPYYEWNPDRTIDHFKRGDRNVEKFMTFNLPICDLGKATGNSKVHALDGCGAECQIVNRLRTCREFSKAWPKSFEDIQWNYACAFDHTQCCKETGPSYVDGGQAVGTCHNY